MSKIEKQLWHHDLVLIDSEQDWLIEDDEFDTHIYKEDIEDDHIPFLQPEMKILYIIPVLTLYVVINIDPIP